ncbi:hypothetical protein AAU61_16775 [Desulfocarbo indianensis]|nr:hypothetical protein AAU61_16775 [Desulfocarbo indianensis]
MLETEYRNLTDLFLDQASEDIRNKQFKDAANLIVMAITEFDEQADIAKYLAYIFKQITSEDVEGLVTELSKEMMWLCPKPYVSQDTRAKMLAFKRQAAPLLESYGFEVWPEGECPQIVDGLPAQVHAYLFALKKKKEEERSDQHPY